MVLKNKTDGVLLNGTDQGEEIGKVDPKDHDSIYCGCGNCRPSFMQSYATINCFTAMYCFVGLSTSTLGYYISSQITTLERQFGLSSSTSGFILSCNEFGYLLTALVLSYVTRRVHIPRVLTVCILVYGISAMACSLPYFVTRDDIPSAAEMKSRNSSFVESVESMFPTSLCEPMTGTPMSNETSDTVASIVTPVSREESRCAVKNPQDVRHGAVSENGRVFAISCLAIGMVVQGLSKSLRPPFVGTYIDDNVPKTKTSLHLAFISGAGVLGPALGYTLGGLFTKIYITLEDTDMSPLDPRWLGAWWLGFLVFGSFAIFTAIPLFFFPRRLTAQTQLRALEQAKKESRKGENKYVHELKEFLRSVLRLLTSPVYMLVVLAFCLMMLGFIGMGSFLPKYLETQFLIPAWQANIMTGVMNICASALGFLIGGSVPTYFKFTPLKYLKMMIGASVVTSCLIVVTFFLGCEQPTISMGLSSSAIPDVSTTNVCKGNCMCDNTAFFPTCGADGVTYFSPCHAGCLHLEGMSFSNCSCIDMPNISSGTVPEATPGFCKSNCGNLYPYLILNFFGAFSASLIGIPSFILTMRSVSDIDKPLAIGMSAFLLTLLGWFPSPVIYGQIVDSACLLWSSGCSGGGSCTLYDLKAFRLRFHSILACTWIGKIVLYVIAFVIASRKSTPFVEYKDEERMQPAVSESKNMLQENVKVRSRGDESGIELIFG